jgi:hypothetical protein
MLNNKNLRTTAVLIALVLLSACSVLPYQSDTDDIRNIAGKIAGYDLPEAYSEQFGVDALGYQLVSLTGPTPNCHIYLLQAPKDSQDDLENMQSQAEKLEAQQNRKPLKNLRVVEVREVNIRGKAVNLIVSEAVNGSNQPYRVVTAVFEGRSGPALVNISSPLDLWDWELADSFLASIN